MKVVDDVLPQDMFSRVKQVAHSGVFESLTSPYDDIEYPGICADIPPWMKAVFKSEIAKAMGRSVASVEIQAMFMRVTTTNTPPAPHGAHNDAIHGTHSMFYYINDEPADLRSLAGTSLLSHKVTGMKGSPQTVEEWDAWKRDTNDYHAWHIDDMAFWSPNRMAIYEAGRMHRAEPPGGWGSDQTDGRLVLIIFFS